MAFDIVAAYGIHLDIKFGKFEIIQPFADGGIIFFEQETVEAGLMKVSRLTRRFRCGPKIAAEHAIAFGTCFLNAPDNAGKRHTGKYQSL